ncbi:MAG: VanZ family protein [Deltaproteobacteria bacterium]|nr:VanZ family protein [Deltaproteobacteria bacterium]
MTRERSRCDAVARWLPVAVWATVISVLSGDSFQGENTATWLRPLLEMLLPGAAPATVEAAHAIVRKLAHVTEYAILALLAGRALDRPARAPRGVALGALALCAGYAVLDEIHQSFVPSRGASPVDVALDTFGAAVGIAIRLGIPARPLSAGRRSPA